MGEWGWEMGVASVNNSVSLSTSTCEAWYVLGLGREGIPQRNGGHFQPLGSPCGWETSGTQTHANDGALGEPLRSRRGLRRRAWVCGDQVRAAFVRGRVVGRRWRTPRAGHSLSTGESVGPDQSVSQPQGRREAGNRKELGSRGGQTGLNAVLAWKPQKHTKKQGFESQLQGRGAHARHRGQLQAVLLRKLGEPGGTQTCVVPPEGRGMCIHQLLGDSKSLHLLRSPGECRAQRGPRPPGRRWLGHRRSTQHTQARALPLSL